MIRQKCVIHIGRVMIANNDDTKKVLLFSLVTDCINDEGRPPQRKGVDATVKIVLDGAQ